MAVGGAADLTTLDGALRTVYPEGTIREQLYEKNPLFALLKKKEFAGKTENVAVRTTGQQGRSASFARAQNNRSTSNTIQFATTTVKDYAVGRIETEALYAEKNSKGSLVTKVSDEMYGSMIAMDRSLAVGVWGNGGGAIGRISAYAAGPPAVITLADSRSIVNFEAGQVLQVATTDGTSGAVKAGRLRVDKINRNSNTVEVTNGGFNGEAAVVTPAANDYIFVDGDFGAKISGMAAWFPDSDPTSGDSFFGVDRSVDPLRLAGVRYDATVGQSIRETIRTALTHALVNNARPKHLFMHPEAYNIFVNSLSGQERYDQNGTIKVSARVSFQTITFVGPYGPVQIIPDPNCPFNRAYCLDMSTLCYASRNNGPDYMRLGETSVKGGRGISKFVDDADELEWRIGAFAQIQCTAPGNNVTMSLGLSL